MCCILIGDISIQLKMHDDGKISYNNGLYKLEYSIIGHWAEMRIIHLR